jgi:hypothetical protein
MAKVLLFAEQFAKGTAVLPDALMRPLAQKNGWFAGQS